MKKTFHYSWIILTVSFLGILAVQGLRYSFGAFMTPWEQDFSVSRGTVSAISFVSFVVFALSQPIVGKLIDKYGVKRIFVYSTIILGFTTILTYFTTEVWQLFILYGVISSFGFGGASGVTASLVVTKWFHKKQGLAFGIIEAGFGAGQMVIVPSSLILINQLGWKPTVLILGGFLLLFVFPILALLLKSDPFEKGLSALGEEKSAVNITKEQKNSVEQPNKRFIFHRSFWFLIIPYFICGFTTTGLMDTHLIPYAQNCGFSIAVTGAAVSLLAFFNTGGTVISGILADKLDNKKMVTFIYLFRGFTILFLLIFTLNLHWLSFMLEHPWILFVFSISFGLVDFAVVPPTIKLLSSLFKGPSLGIVTGFLYMSHQLGSALGSYLPGVLFDLLGSYTSTFIMAAALLFLASIFSALLPKTSSNTMKQLKSNVS